MKLTQTEIETIGSYEFADEPDGCHWFTCYITSHLFNANVKVNVNLIDGLNAISDKQVQIINDFLELGPDSIPHIKKKLFQHWASYEGVYESGTLNIRTEDDAYKNSTFKELLIWSSDMFDGRGANLCFDVEWDSEHGASIVLWNGELKEAHDIQDYFFDYESN